MGYYGGDGARKVATVMPSVSLPQSQPACATRWQTGLVDCGNWAVVGVVGGARRRGLGRLLRASGRTDGTAGDSHIVFVVRDDAGRSDLLFQTSDTTWQAYNQYGGNSLYAGGPGIDPGRAYKVSYNRPFTTRGTSPEDLVFNAEYPMIRWLERNGYDVSYTTGVDTDRRGELIRNHRVFLSVGHDEYWSGAQRANVEAARDAGVNLAFFSGNEMFWKTRWDDVLIARWSPTRRRTTAPRSTRASAWTGSWRDPRAFNPEGGRPENALTGTIFMVNSGDAATPGAARRRQAARSGAARAWPRNAAAGQTSTLAPNTVGYEWDEDLDNGARPAGLVRLSTTTATGADVLQDFGHTFATGTATHHLTLYRDTNGAGPDALVFGAGYGPVVLGPGLRARPRERRGRSPRCSRPR